MKNRIIITLLLLSFASFAQKSDSTGSTRTASIQVGDSTKTAPYLRQTPSRIPAFSIELGDSIVAPRSSVFSSEELVAARPVLISYMDPTCSHCMQEAILLRIAMDSAQLGDLQVVMVAPKADGVREMVKQFRLSGRPNLHIGWETGYKLMDWYGVSQTPFNAWYDKDGVLVRTGVQDFKIEELKAWLATGKMPEVATKPKMPEGDLQSNQKTDQ